MPAGGGQPNPLDLREIFRTLRRRVSVVVVVPAVLVLLALIFVTVVTPLYTGIATVFIDPRRSSVVDTGSQASPSNYATDDASVESQVALIESIAVLQRVVEGQKLIDDPEFVPPPGMFDAIKGLFSSRSGAGTEDVARARALENLQRKLKVVRQRSTFLVDINLSSRDAAKAARIANAIADEFFTEQVRSKLDARKIASTWLNRQIGELKLRVAVSDKAVEDFRATNNLTVSQGVTLNDQQITDLNNKLIEASVQTAEARAKYDQVQEIAKSKGDPGSVTEALSSEIIGRLRGQYADLAKSAPSAGVVGGGATARYAAPHQRGGRARPAEPSTQL
jgi:succinoglycan biosynthesis transport protein ExoP